MLRHPPSQNFQNFPPLPSVQLTKFSPAQPFTVVPILTQEWVVKQSRLMH